jgi:hypothetical protein
MEFTPQQIGLIKRLRKQNRQWMMTRWIILALGILSVLASCVAAYALYLVAFEPPQDSLNSLTVFIILSLWTICCLNLLFGMWCFAAAYVKWHGDSIRILLLKLLDAQEKSLE